MIRTVIVSPSDRLGRFDAQMQDGPVLVRSSRAPFCDAARRLLELGAEPATILTMRHAGSDIESLRASIGTAAKLTVEERDSRPPRIVAWKARDLTEGSPRTAIERLADAGQRAGSVGATP